MKFLKGKGKGKGKGWKQRATESPDDVAARRAREMWAVPRVSLTHFNALATTRDGLMLYHRTDVYVGKSIDLYGEFSRDERRFLVDLLEPGDVVVDGGANIGALTLALSDAVGPNGVVLAFEPQPFTFHVLCANVALNSRLNVNCAPVALGRDVGQAQFPVVDFGAPANVGGVGRVMDPEFKGSTYTVQMVPLDQFDLERLDLLKLDLEGGEVDALAGATATIARCRPVLYVEDDRPDQSADLHAAIDALGYDAWGHRPPLFSPYNWRGESTNVFGDTVSLNLVCLPRDTENDRHHELRAICEIDPTMTKGGRGR